MIPLGLETPLQATLQEAISYFYGVLPKSNASDPDDVTYFYASGYCGKNGPEKKMVIYFGLILAQWRLSIYSSSSLTEMRRFSALFRGAFLLFDN